MEVRLPHRLVAVIKRDTDGKTQHVVFGASQGLVWICFLAGSTLTSSFLIPAPAAAKNKDNYLLNALKKSQFKFLNSAIFQAIIFIKVQAECVIDISPGNLDSSLCFF